MSSSPPPAPAEPPRTAAIRLRAALVSLRELLITGGPVLLLAIGLVWLAYEVLDPNPPRQATGLKRGRDCSRGVGSVCAKPVSDPWGDEGAAYNSTP